LKKTELFAHTIAIDQVFFKKFNPDKFFVGQPSQNYGVSVTKSGVT